MCQLHDIRIDDNANHESATSAGQREQTTEAFSERLVSFLNHGALALMLSLGHRSGLFDTMAQLPPSTPEAIASAAGLQPRYVKEWLGAMVTGGIVTHEPAEGTYALPSAHAAALTRGAAPNNVAAFMQYIPLLGSVEDKVLQCFRTGGGVPYAAYPRFQEVMADESGQTVLPALLDVILPLDPGLPARLRRGMHVLEFGCGSGRALNLLAQTFPASRFVGIDISAQGIRRARTGAARKGLDNIRFEQRDAATIDEHARFDLVLALDAVHDQARPRDVLRNVRRALRPRGRFLMQDIDASSHVRDNADHPLGPFLYTVSCMHCMTVSLAEGGAGLGAMWGREQALTMLAEAGFTSTIVHRLPHDVQNCYYLSRIDGD
ncbi:MAG: class I SAM-dependent methyltransferase [Myxococcota bacterium]